MNDLDRAYLSALRILRYRFNSAAELRRKLIAKGIERELIDQVLVKLTNEKWLDDARFAGAYVRTRILKRIGRARIRRELMAAGVADDIIEDAIRANINAEDEREKAIAAGTKRLAILQRRNDPQQTRNKLTVYLLKQGYDGALVRSIVKEILLANPHD